jgi:hypothetical protein
LLQPTSTPENWRLNRLRLWNGSPFRQGPLFLGKNRQKWTFVRDFAA